MAEMKTFNGKEVIDTTAREDISRLSSEMANKVGTSELNTAVDNALTQAKESGAFNGADGQDGADGKDGSDGNDGYTPIKGVDYFDGKDGEDGYTPVKGTDYWTEDDKEAIVTEARAELSQLEPLFAESVEWLEENGDTSKVYILPDTEIYAYIPTEETTKIVEVQSGNMLYLGIDTDGSLYNGTGWKEDYRLNSSGVESSYGGMDVTGYIPIKVGDKITITGAKASGNTSYFHYYDSSFAWLSKADGDKTGGESPNTTYTVTNKNAKYFRMTANLSDASIIITSLETVTEGGVSYTNQLKNAVDTDDTPYNDGLGYKIGYRLNSSATEVELEGAMMTGYIPYSQEDVIRFSGCPNAEPSGYVFCYAEDKTLIGTLPMSITDWIGYGATCELDNNLGCYVLTIDRTALTSDWINDDAQMDSACYIRFSVQNAIEESLIVTFNEEITTSTSITESEIAINWSMDVKIDKTTGAESTSDGYAASQLIELDADSTYRLDYDGMKGCSMDVCWYDESQAFTGYTTAWAQSSESATGSYTLIPNGAKYIRLRSAVAYTDDTIAATELADISLIKITTSTTSAKAWQSTGHTFVPADYEDRVVSLEASTKNLNSAAVDHEKRLKELEATDLEDGIPTYVKEEAERVADLLLECMTENCLVSAHFSDVHYFYGTVNTVPLQALQHTAYGINEIGKLINLDYIANHGDFDTDETTEKTKLAVKKINSILNNEKEIQLVGNHDVVEKPFTESQLFAYIGSQNTHCVLDDENKAGIYGYKDFEHCKMRVIFLNTSDSLAATNECYAMVSPKQMQWVIDKALDFSDKADPTAWGINVISHIPLHWDGHLQQMLQVFDAYISGTRGSATADGQTISYDFSTRERAELICYYHGHVHNFSYRFIGSHSTPCIATPQVCTGRYNEYGTSAPTLGGELDAEGNPVYWYKTANTAESTSFVVNVIDRVNKKIHSIHYGAGTDREIDY